MKRIIGFDLARAYAIFGMYIVNFNIVFGNAQDKSFVGQLLALFSGNSSTVFVMLAGMGVALMSNRGQAYKTEEKKQLKKVINRRAWFLFFLGLLLYAWWPADILHFYGGYMHIAVFFLLVDKKYYLYIAAASILIFHLLLLIIPYETGWNFETIAYQDFWTVTGFLRNTIYNGWNAIFPWLAFFAIGLYLGRLNWSLQKTQKNVFIVGLALYGSISLIQFLSNKIPMHEDLKFYINADYLPPFLPFVLSTVGFGLMLITGFVLLSKYLSNHPLAINLAKTGQMTLTHYISHLTIGMLLLALLTQRPYEAKLHEAAALPPVLILCFALFYYLLSYWFSQFWSRRFAHGPFEWLMRKIAG
jgi:uncharacterized protein